MPSKLERRESDWCIIIKIVISTNLHMHKYALKKMFYSLRNILHQNTWVVILTQGKITQNLTSDTESVHKAIWKSNVLYS